MTQLINDEGINQYDAVRKAYERARTLLQNENPDRKGLSDLLDVFDKNPKGVDWLKLEEEGEEYETVYGNISAIGKEEKLKTMCKRSYEILESINSNFRREDGLYRPRFDMSSKEVKSDDPLTVGNEDIHTNIHAGMAILYSTLGNITEAESILGKFEEKIKNRTRLYRWSDRGESILTSDNALMAVAYASIENRQKAEEIFDAIESKCQKLPDSLYSDVICDDLKPYEIRADTNAAMGIAHRVIGNDSRANAIIPSLDAIFRVKNSMLYHNSIKYPVKFTQSAIDSEVERSYIYTSTNALIAFAYAISGYYEKVELILEEIEEKRYVHLPLFSSRLRGDIFFEIDKKRVNPIDNALMAIAYALKDGAKLCGLPKREKP